MARYSLKSTLVTLLSVSIMIVLYYLNRDSTYKDVITFSSQSVKEHFGSKSALHSSFDRWVIIKQPGADNQFCGAAARQLHDWKILVIVESDERNDVCRTKNCLTFHKAHQKQWMYPKDSNPQNSAVRFAVAHGAKMVYVTDGSRSVQDLLQLHLDSDSISILVSADVTLFNHYFHFGQPGTYPRAFPGMLKEPKRRTSTSYKLLEQWKRPAIQHVVDLDTFQFQKQPNISPLSNQHQQQEHMFNILAKDEQIFDPLSPPVLVPPGTWSFYGSKYTLYTYNSLWCLLQPITLRPELKEIWRSLYTQKLLWEIDEGVGFYPSTTKRALQNTINLFRTEYLKKRRINNEITALHAQITGELVRFLSFWTCPHSHTFFQCMIKLSMDLSTSGFWTKNDVTLTKQWVEFLKLYEYTAPSRITKGPNFFKNSKRIRYVSPQTGSIIDGTSAFNFNSYNVTHHVKEVSNICNNFSKNFDDDYQVLESQYKESGGFSKIDKLNQFFSDVLVLVVFNTPHYKNLNSILKAFMPIYPNVVFCGYNWRAFQIHTSYIKRPLTFIEFFSKRGHYGYQCTSIAMKMGYRVKGYFHTGDDVIHFWWHSLPLDTQQIWMNRNLSTITNGWFWWKNASGSESYEHSIHHIKSTTRPISAKDITVSHDTFLKNLLDNTNGAGVIRGVSDTMYIPERYKKDVIYYFDIFYKEKTFLEIAVPVVIWGITKLENIWMFGTRSLWYDDRKNLTMFYEQDFKNDTILTLHPAKLSTLNSKSFFCNTYLVDLLKQITKQ